MSLPKAEDPKLFEWRWVAGTEERRVYGAATDVTLRDIAALAYVAGRRYAADAAEAYEFADAFLDARAKVGQ